MKERTEDVSSQERAKDGHDDIDQQVRAIMHEFGRHPADHCSNDKIYKNVHFCLHLPLYKFLFIDILLGYLKIFHNQNGLYPLPVPGPVVIGFGSQFFQPGEIVGEFFHMGKDNLSGLKHAVIR